MARRDPARSAARADCRLLLVLSIGVLAQGCASAPPPCPPPAQAMVRETLYFGMRLPSGGLVDAAAWQGFLAETVTPRFPAGYTVLDATGHWRDEQGRGIEEPAKVLIVLHPPAVAATTALAEIIHAYSNRFAQDAVLHETSAVCAGF